MKLYRTLLLACTTTLLVAGCASGPQYREMAASIPTLASDQGRVYFFRESSIFGATLQPDIKLNGQVVGRSTPGGFFYVDEPAGDYTAATRTEVERTVSFSLHAGETRYVRTTVGMGILIGHVTPTLEDGESATKTIADLKYTGPAGPHDDTPQPKKN
jgi:hypothetical protein